MSGGTDDTTPFARAQLGPLIAVLMRVCDAPALAFDMATEAVATAEWFAFDAGGPVTPIDKVRHITEAAEHVFNATFAQGRVPHRARLRAAEPKRYQLSATNLAEIKQLALHPLDDVKYAERLIEVLSHDAPSTRDIRAIGTSPLVSAPPPEHESES